MRRQTHVMLVALALQPQQARENADTFLAVRRDACSCCNEAIVHGDAQHHAASSNAATARVLNDERKTLDCSRAVACSAGGGGVGEKGEKGGFICRLWRSRVKNDGK